MSKPNSSGASAAQVQEPSLADVLAELRAMREENAALAERVEAAEAFQQEVLAGLQDDGELSDEELDELAQAGEVGEAGEEGEPVGAGAGESAELAALNRTVTELQSRLDQRDQAEVVASREQQFDVLDQKITALCAENQRLQAENDALRQSSGRGVTALSAGVEGVAMVRRPEQTEFEAKVDEFKASGKKGTEAIRLAMREHPGLYQQHLASRGAIKG